MRLEEQGGSVGSGGGRRDGVKAARIDGRKFDEGRKVV